MIVVHRRRLGVLLVRRRSVVLILAVMYVVPLLLVLLKYWTRLILSLITRTLQVVMDMIHSSKRQFTGRCRFYGHACTHYSPP